MINFHKIAAAVAGTMLLASAGPATAEVWPDGSVVDLSEPGMIMFHEPVAIQGTVLDKANGQVLIEAENGQVIEMGKMALVWNGDRDIFAQDAEIGDNIIVHLREREPYRVMDSSGDVLIIGSYDGVFYLPESFIAAIDIDGLDDDIYADADDIDRDAYSDEFTYLQDDEGRMYYMHDVDNDGDLETVYRYEDEEVATRDLDGDGDIDVYYVMDDQETTLGIYDNDLTDPAVAIENDDDEHVIVER